MKNGATKFCAKRSKCIKRSISSASSVQRQIVELDIRLLQSAARPESVLRNADSQANRASSQRTEEDCVQTQEVKRSREISSCETNDLVIFQDDYIERTRSHVYSKHQEEQERFVQRAARSIKGFHEECTIFVMAKAE